MTSSRFKRATSRGASRQRGQAWPRSRHHPTKLQPLPADAHQGRRLLFDLLLPSWRLLGSRCCRLPRSRSLLAPASQPVERPELLVDLLLGLDNRRRPCTVDLLLGLDLLLLPCLLHLLPLPAAELLVEAAEQLVEQEAATWELRLQVRQHLVGRAPFRQCRSSSARAIAIWHCLVDSMHRK